MNNCLRWSGTVLLTAVLAACGGGGGGGGGFPIMAGPLTPAETPVPPAQIADFDLAAGHASYIAGTAHYEVSGRAAAQGEIIDFKGFVDVTAPVASSFDGMPTLRKTTSGTLRATDQRGGTETQSSSADRHYDSNYQQVATVTSGTAGNFEVVTMASLPAKVQPGASGEWSRSTVYSDAALIKELNTISTRYTVERESETTAVLSVIGTARSGGATLEVTDRYRLQGDRSMRQISQSVNARNINSTLNYR